MRFFENRGDNEYYFWEFGGEMIVSNEVVIIVLELVFLLLRALLFLEFLE